MITVTTKVWGPGVTPTSHTLVAVPGDKITPEQAEELNVDPETGAQIDSTVQEPQPTPPADDDETEGDGDDELTVFPTAEEIAVMTAKELAKVDKDFGLGVGKMNVDDKRAAVAGAIHELTVELDGLTGLDAEAILELEAAASSEAAGGDQG